MLPHWKQSQWNSKKSVATKVTPNKISKAPKPKTAESAASPKARNVAFPYYKKRVGTIYLRFFSQKRPFANKNKSERSQNYVYFTL